MACPGHVRWMRRCTGSWTGQPCVQTVSDSAGLPPSRQQVRSPSFIPGAGGLTMPTVRRLAPQVYVLGGGPEDWRMINSPGRPMLTDCDRPSRRSTSVSAITRPTSRGA